MTTNHTLKVGGNIGSPNRQLAHGSDHLDRHHVQQLCWIYRYMRTIGVGPSSARMLLHSAYCQGFAAGHHKGVGLAPRTQERRQNSTADGTDVAGAA